MQTRSLGIAVFVLIVFMGYIVSASDRDEILREQAHYCEMVALFYSSDGDTGWPDYENVYDTQCVKE